MTDKTKCPWTGEECDCVPRSGVTHCAAEGTAFCSHCGADHCLTCDGCDCPGQECDCGEGFVE